MNAVNDVVDNDLSIGDALRKRGNEGIRNLKRRAAENMSGDGLRVKRNKSKIHSSHDSGGGKKQKPIANKKSNATKKSSANKKPSAKQAKVVKKTKSTKVTRNNKKKKEDSSEKEFDYYF